MKPSGRLVQLIDRIENLKINPFGWILVFFSIVVARNFLEQFGPELVVFNFPSFFLHFPLAYIAPILALSILLALLARQRVEKVTKLMLFAWFLTLIPPLIDLLIGKGTGERIGYLYVDRSSVFHFLINFFNPSVGLRGTTAGIRIEAFAGCILACAYVFLKTRDRLRTIITLFVIYLSFLFFFTLPYTFIIALSSVWPKFGNLGLLYFESGIFLKSHIDRVAYAIALLDILLIFALLIWWVRLHSREALRTIFRRLAGFPPLHYCLATLFGMVLAIKLINPQSISLHIFDVFAGIALMISVLCIYWVCTWMKERPPSDSISRFSLFVAILLGMLFSGLVSYSSLVFALALLAFLCLYYARPLNLHRYFPAATILIALATLSCMLLGFSTAAGTLVPKLFSRHIIWATLISSVLAYTAKDYIASGRRGKVGAAVLLFLGFASVGLILRSDFLMWVGVILGLCVSAFMLFRAYTRFVLYAAYGLFGLLVTVMTIRGELPTVLAEPIDAEQVLHLQRANQFQIGKMYEHSAIEFEKAISAGWQDAGTYFALGFAYQQSGELEKSSYWYRRSIEEDSNCVEAYNNLGSVLRRIGELDSSEAVLRRGLKKDPGSARMLRNLFLTLFDLGESEVLLPMLESYLETNPDDYGVREVLADAYVAVGNEFAAETEYRKVLGTREGYVPAIVGLGYIFANRGETNRAEKHFLVALQMDPENVDALHRMGYIHLERGDAAQAVSYFKEVVMLEPLVANHYDSLGDAYMKGEEYDLAREAYQMALALDSTAVHPREMLEKLGSLR